MATFNPPVAYDNPAVLPTTTGIKYRLFRYYGPYPRGRSVVLVNGHWTIMDTPFNDTYVQGKDGVDFFLGGHVYNLTSAQVTALTADGLAAYIT